MQANHASDTSPDKISFKARCALGAIKLIGLLPLNFARALGASIGWFLWLVKDRSSKVTLENIKLCYPELSRAEHHRLARRSMIETGKLAAEILSVYQHSYTWLKKRIFQVHGEELIRQQIERGKGLILLAPHLGNWEVLSLLLPDYGKLTALYQPPKHRYLEELVKAAREKTGATLVPTNRSGMAKLLNSLKQGGITAVLPDQNPEDDFGLFSPFFGHPAYTMTTVHGFVKRSDFAVLMGFVKRVRGGFEVYFIEAPEEIYSADRETSLAAMNAAIENCISYCPEQYQWEYKRFKKIPPGVGPRYQF